LLRREGFTISMYKLEIRVPRCKLEATAGSMYGVVSKDEI